MRCLLGVLSLLISYGAAAGPATPNAPLATGVVRDVSGQPLQNIQVRSGYQAADGIYRVYGLDYTAADGSFSIPMPSPAPPAQWVFAGGGGYELIVHPSTICYSSSQCPAPGDPLPATSPVPASGFDFSLRRTGSLQGTVVLAADGSAYTSPTTIRLLRADGTAGHIIGTSAAGSFSDSSIVAGTYYLLANPHSANLLEQIHPGVDLDPTRTALDAIAQGAPAIEIFENRTTAVQIRLTSGGCVQGSLTSADGHAVLHTLLAAKRTAPSIGADFRDIGASNGGGTYRSARLAPGSVKIRFQPLYDATAFPPVYYPQSASEDGSTEVPVIAGECTSGIDAILMPRRSIRGTVRDEATKAPLPGIRVNLGFLSVAEFASTGSAVTNSAGEFVLQGMEAAEDYRFRVLPQGRHFGEAFRELPLFSHPSGWTAVALGDAQHETGIDFSLDRGAFFTGAVMLYPNQTPADYFVVEAINVDTGKATVFFGSESGPYETDAIEPGRYRVRFAYLQYDAYGWPGVRCTTPQCDDPGIATIDVDEVREFAGYDFDFIALDSVFQGSFE